MDLLRFFPTYQDLEAAPVPTVADKVIRYIASQAGPDFAGSIHFRNVVMTVGGAYGGRWESGRAVSEAISWLIAKQLLTQSPADDLGWYVLTRSGIESIAQTSVSDWMAERELPATWLHPIVSGEALDHFRQGKFDTAVFVAFRALEVEIRRAAGLGPDLVGTKLVAAAFHPEHGPLTDQDAEGGEKQALMNLMSGSIGSYKNPTSHRHMELSGQEAREMLMLASHLIRIVQSRHTAKVPGSVQ